MVSTLEVEKLSAVIPLSFEQIINDNLIEDGPLLAMMREKVAEERAEEERLWRALPWYARAYRTVLSWRWRTTYAVREWLHSRLFPDHADLD